MLRIVAAGLTALFVTASPLAYAQTAASAATIPSAAEWNSLTDMRIDVVKAALKLTPDKFWSSDSSRHASSRPVADLTITFAVCHFL